MVEKLIGVWILLLLIVLWVSTVWLAIASYEVHFLVGAFVTLLVPIPSWAVWEFGRDVIDRLRD